MRRITPYLLWSIAILFIVAIGGAITGFRDFLSGGEGPRMSCQSNLKQIGLGFMMYTQDYNDRWPLVRVHEVAESLKPYDSPFGWADALYPYLKSTQLFQCPDDELPVNQRQDAVLGRFTDYYYNSNLSGLNLDSMRSLSAIFLAADGNDGTDGSDARYNRNLLPRAWREDPKSPARRHLEGANYAFADGHMKWLKPELVKDIRASQNDYSFEVK